MESYIFMALIALLYFIPSVVAYRRKHLNLQSIILVNLIFGWTFLGWVAALIWSYTSNVEDENEVCPHLRVTQQDCRCVNGPDDCGHRRVHGSRGPVCTL